MVGLQLYSSWGHIIVVIVNSQCDNAIIPAIAGSGFDAFLVGLGCVSLPFSTLCGLLLLLLLLFILDMNRSWVKGTEAMGGRFYRLWRGDRLCLMFAVAIEVRGQTLQSFCFCLTGCLWVSLETSS